MYIFRQEKKSGCIKVWNSVNNIINYIMLDYFNSVVLSNLYLLK